MSVKTFTATAQIPATRVSNLLCSAFEGGSNYWYCIKSFVTPPALEFRFDEDNKTIFRHLDYPLNDGGALIIVDIEDDRGQSYKLDLESIQKGITIMSGDPKYAQHWADFIGENDDATTGDVFLQLCLFGEIVYG